MASSLNIARVHLQVAKKTKSNGQTAIADKNLVEAVRAQNKLRGTIKRLKARCLFLATETIVLNAEKIKPEKQQVTIKTTQNSIKY